MHFGSRSTAAADPQIYCTQRTTVWKPSPARSTLMSRPCLVIYSPRLIVVSVVGGTTTTLKCSFIKYAVERMVHNRKLQVLLFIIGRNGGRNQGETKELGSSSIIIIIIIIVPQKMVFILSTVAGHKSPQTSMTTTPKKKKQSIITIILHVLCVVPSLGFCDEIKC